MPRIQPDSNNFTANNVDVKKLFRQRLMDRFKPQEFVRVINPDDETFTWSYMPQSKEDLQMSNDGMHRYAIREEAEWYQLQPGESEVLVGENAYVMIEGLYKKMVAKKLYDTQGEYKQGMPARNFNFSDALAQEQFIDKIYLGKEQPNFSFEDKNDTTTAENTSSTRPKSPRA